MDYDKAPEALPKQPGLEVWRPTSFSHASAHSYAFWPWSGRRHIYSDTSSQKVSHRRVGFGSGLLLGLLIALITVGATLGGGLGTALVSCQKNADVHADAPTTAAPPTATSSSTSITSFEDYAPADQNEVSSLRNDCDPNRNTVNSFGHVFSPSCNFDYYKNFPAAEGGVIADIMVMISYSWQDCLDACSGLNNRSSQWEMPTRCRSIVFKTNMRDSTAASLGNCWLKNATLADPGQAKANQYAMSAKLISPLV